jgi:hypothetical protein
MSSTGFASVPRWIVNDEQISGNAKLVYLVLSSHSNEDGDVFPAHARIATLAGISVSSVQRALRELRERRVVDWDQQDREHGGRTSNLYQLATTRRKAVGQGDRGGRSEGPRGSVSVTEEVEPLKENHGTLSAGGVEAKAQALWDDLIEAQENRPPRATKPRGEVDPNVEKLAAGLVEALAANRVPARVDATTRRICGRVLALPGVTVEEALHVAEFATSDSFWRAQVVSPAAFGKHFTKLRLRMPTTGPAAATVAAPAVGAVPLLGDGEHEAAQRARAFLARGFSPARYWDAEQHGEHASLIRRVLSSPVLFDEVDVEGLVIAWNFRAEGRKLSDAVEAWPDYS